MVYMQRVRLSIETDDGYTEITRTGDHFSVHGLVAQCVTAAADERPTDTQLTALADVVARAVGGWARL